LFDNEIKAFLWLDIGGAFYNIMLDSGAKARRYHARSNAWTHQARAVVSRASWWGLERL